MNGGKGQRVLAVIGLLSVIGFVVGAAAFLLMLRSGLSTRDAPSRLEATLAHAARALARPASARSLVAPAKASSPEALTEARAHWASHCAICHGDDGAGSSPIGRALYPRAPDMRAPQTQGLTDGELYDVIKNGVRLTGMPAWGTPGADDGETWALVAFLRTLPRLTPEELAEIRRNTPRTPHELKEEREEEQFLQGLPPDPDPKEHHP